MRRDLDDLHAVRHEHIAIHERLLNWARWSRDRRGSGWGIQPMFRHYRPYIYPREASARVEVDGLDALAVQKVFAAVPELHRHVLNWHYLYPGLHYRAVCRRLGVSKDDLSEILHAGRAMVTNLSRKGLDRPN